MYLLSSSFFFIIKWQSVALCPSHAQILKEDPAYPEALIGRGTAHAFKRDLHAAIADFTKVFIHTHTLSERCINICLFPLFLNSLCVAFLRLYNLIHQLVRHGRGEVRPGQPWGSLLRWGWPTLFWYLSHFVVLPKSHFWLKYHLCLNKDLS